MRAREGDAFRVLAPFRVWRQVGIRRASTRPTAGNATVPVREVANARPGEEVLVTGDAQFLIGTGAAHLVLLQHPLPAGGRHHPHRPVEHMLAMTALGRAERIPSTTLALDPEAVAAASEALLPATTPLETIVEPSPQHAFATSLARRCVDLLDAAGLRASTYGSEASWQGPGRVTIGGPGIEAVVATNAYGYVMVSLPRGTEGVPKGLGKVEGDRHVVRFGHAETAQAASTALLEAVFEAVVRRWAPEGGPHP